MEPHIFTRYTKAYQISHPTDGEVGGYEKVDDKFRYYWFRKSSDGKVIVDFGSKGSYHDGAKRLKQGRNGIKSISRVQPSFGKQIDKRTEVTEGKSKYHTWKEDKTLTPKQKIGFHQRG